MLENSKILNTSNNIFYSYKVRDVTMNNQQVALYKKMNNYVLKIIRFFKHVLLRYLRDFTGIAILLLGGLRYSPLFCSLMKGGGCFAGETTALKKSFFFINVCNLLKREFSSISYQRDKLDPNWVTGFVDAEGCFSVMVEISTPYGAEVPKGAREDLKRKVKISFEINLHEKDKDILYKIQSFFGVGAVYNRKDRPISWYRVTNITFINNVIIPHFTNYPLISKKAVDFQLWCKVVEIISNKEHLTEEGFLKILSYYASINRGASKKVLHHYPNILPADKPIINLPNNLNPQWVSGFTGGDGGFSIYVRPAKDYVFPLRARGGAAGGPNKVMGGEKVYCQFRITQHSKDLELMQLFIKFFGTGKVHVRSNTSTPRCDFIVQDTSFLLDKIISHFNLYPLLNLKQEDYLCFREALLLIKEKKHLTREGLDKIKSLNLEMNSNRLK